MVKFVCLNTKIQKEGHNYRSLFLNIMNINTSQESFIVGLGEILWDVFPTGKMLGGAPANFAYHVSCLGSKGLVVSAIGDDQLAQETMKKLKAKGLSVCLQQLANYPTGTVQVSVDDKGIPYYIINDHVAWDYMEFTPQVEQVASCAAAVCFGSLAQRHPVSRQTFYRFFEAMPQKSLKVFDINLRQNFYSHEVIESSLNVANVLKMNNEELIVLKSLFALRGDNPTVCRQIRAMFNLAVVILTMGAEGSIVETETDSSFLPTPVVRVVDTVGAGDAFTAAFVVSFLQGDSIVQAHKKAVALSAFVCTQKGAMPSYPKELV